MATSYLTGHGKDSTNSGKTLFKTAFIGQNVLIRKEFYDLFLLVQFLSIHCVIYLSISSSEEWNITEFSDDNEEYLKKGNSKLKGFLLATLFVPKELLWPLFVILSRINSSR